MIYRHIQPRYFFGYNLVEIPGFRFKIAAPEKAVLDFLYLSPGLKREEDMEELRFNRDEVREKIDEVILDTFIVKFNHRSLRERARLWLEVMRHA